MSVVLLLSSLFLFTNFGINALPLIYPRADSQPFNIVSRSVFDIIYSCLATTFFCVGVSASPNVPPKGDLLIERWRLILWMLISPELILAWAVRQYFAGVSVTNKYNGTPCRRSSNPWTLYHGYLMVMGGFILVKSKSSNPDDGVESKPSNTDNGDILSHERFLQIVENEEIDFPSITADEIRDRSKTDELGLLLGVLHILSFLFQCIVRYRQHLPITQLELITLNILVCNVFIIAAWRCKAKDVLVPVKIRLPSTYVIQEQISSATSKTSYLKEKLADILFGIIRTETISPGASRVPTFYAPRTVRGYYGRMVVYAIFGAISGVVLYTGVKPSSFPTKSELDTWRYTSLAVIIIPILSVPFDIMIERRDRNNMPKSFLLDLPFGMLFLLHITSKLLLIAQAVVLLRTQPAAAYLVVDWPLYVPHF